MRNPSSFVALALLALNVAVSVQAATYKFGLALPITGADAPTELVAAIRDLVTLGMEDVNAWAATNFPGNTFVLSNIYDTQSSDAVAVRAMFDANQSGIVGMIGEFGSDATMPMALAGNQFNIWQCSGSSTTPQLSDKSQFQRFFRTIPPDNVQGTVLALFVKKMGWDSCAVLAVSNTFGEGLTSRFLATAANLKLNIMTVQTFSTSSETAIANGYLGAVQAIRNSGTRIVLFFGTETDFAAIAKDAQSQGIIGNSEWVWVGTEAVAVLSQALVKHKFSPQVLQLTDGMFYPFIKEKGDQFLPFLARYQKKFNQPDTPYYGTVTLDCAHALARGIAAMVKQIGENNVLTRNVGNKSISDFVQNFTSPTSGAVNFNAQGDRTGLFTIYNMYQGSVAPAAELDVVALAMTKSDTPAKFFGGSTAVPLDKPIQARKYPMYTDVGAIAVLGLSAVLVVLVIGTYGFLVVHRNHPNVRQMSLPMLGLISLGLCMTLGSTVLWVDTPTALTCNLNRWLFVIGFEFTMGATAAKAYRIWKIFDNSTLRKLNKLSNTYLMLGCISVILIQVAILAVFTALAPPSPQLRTSFEAYYYECASSNPSLDRAFAITSLVYNGILVLAVTYLAYKTRKSYSQYRESVYIMYSLQNIFLSALIVSPFLFINLGDFNLGAYFIRALTVNYAVTFTFVCLVGRIALGLHQAITKTSATGVKMSLSNNASSSNGGISSGEVLPGKPTTLTGKYPVKVANALFKTWHTHRLTLFALEGFLGMTRMNNDAEQGKLFKLRSIQFDPSPASYPLCLEIRADSTSYMIQFNKEDDKLTWVRALSVHCLVMSKSSATKSSIPGMSTAGATGGQASTMAPGMAASRAMQFTVTGGHHGAMSQVQSQYKPSS
ncbi:periplasmic binding protein-like I [Blastocladiella britannica]|nr:periplasmic binding protein-like I [Blastocladiella britannica]